MDNETKLCKKCGEVKPSHDFKKASSRRGGYYENTCLCCHRLAVKKYKKENKNKVIEGRKIYEKNNREKINSRKRSYYSDMGYYYSRQKIRERSARENLCDWYIRRLLIASGVTEINGKIIILKREQMLLKKAIMEAQNGITGTRDKRTQDNEQEDYCGDDYTGRGESEDCGLFSGGEAV